MTEKPAKTHNMAAISHDQRNRPALEAGEDYRERPPQHMRPHRYEVMAPIGSGVCESLGPAVSVEWLVGAHNGARNLCTGLLTLQPSDGQTLHRHHVDESITSLQGVVAVEVETRRYELRHLDNLVIPPGLNHHIVNVDPAQTARCHLAYPIATTATSPGTVNPTTGWRSDLRQFNRPAEHMTRFTTAQRYEAAANATFIQYFNDSFIPGSLMCGGYGLFQPGGRLPAHVHDCDESICIIQGVATCWVEGRSYELSDCATALQPRGRVHYFINHTSAPMAMIWVYAGPTAARIVVDERCAVEPNVAWPEGF